MHEALGLIPSTISSPKKKDKIEFSNIRPDLGHHSTSAMKKKAEYNLLAVDCI
jgi:hypothetical protein